MCGRYVSATPPDQLAQYFGAESMIEAPDDPDAAANYNVAPTQGVATVYESGGVRKLDTFHWGLVPFWAKDPKIGSKMINARAETIAEKNSFKRPFAKKRCIIPADGFYEWKKIDGQKRKQPMYMTTSSSPRPRRKVSTVGLPAPSWATHEATWREPATFSVASAPIISRFKPRSMAGRPEQAAFPKGDDEPKSSPPNPPVTVQS